MNTQDISIKNEDELNSFCKKLAPYLSAPMIVGLTGDMGSGKTTFVRTLCKVLNSPDWVNSPTYSIIQRYKSPQFDVLHIDLYRLNGDMDIDLLDIPSQIGQTTLVLIEWINKTDQFDPDLSIHISTIDDTRRSLTIRSSNPWVNEIR